MKTKFLLISLIICLLTLASCTTPIEDSGDTLAQTDAMRTEANEDTIVETQAEISIPNEPEIVCQNDEYTIFMTDGKYYMDFVDGNKLLAGSGAQVGFISFESVGQMKNALLKNELSEMQKNVLRTALYDSASQKVQICNLDNLYEAKLPEGVNVSSVDLTKTTYKTYISSNEEFSGGVIRMISEMEYEKTQKAEVYFHDGKTNIRVIEEKEDVFDGIPCRVIEYEYPATEAIYRDVLFDYQDGDEIMSVRIWYILKSPNNHTSRESDSLPFEISIVGKQNGGCFHATIYATDVPVTLDFLTSFGITPYVEDAEMSTPLDTLSDGGTEIEAQ